MYSWPFINVANGSSKSRVQGEALVVFVQKTKVVETQQMKDFHAIRVAKEAFAKHGPVTMLVKQKGEFWRYFAWKCREKGTTNRRASLIYLDSHKVSADVKMIAMLAEFE